MSQVVAVERSPVDYPNHLNAKEPQRVVLPSARWVPLLLVLLCLVPRAAMTLRIPSVCPDGVLYIRLAQAIDAGDLSTGFRDMSLNIYPVILVALHRLGLDWEAAAAMWGVIVSSLVVLPLWGWARRQFDDRVALVACLLYAIHPKFIEWSPEVMRDPTFWLLFMLAIYWLWRAATEVHVGLFIAAGAAITLATLTRVEGLFLTIPLVLWTWWRWLALETGRRRLVLGAALCVVVFPALLLSVNFIWLWGHSGWASVRLAPLARVRSWVESLWSQPAADVDSLDPPMTTGRMIWKFIPVMTRGMGPVFALLMFGGMWSWRRLWARRDHQPLFYTAVAILCGIWVQLWYDKSICPRYALPIVLMASVFAALGLLGFVARLGRLGQWLRLGRGAEAALLVTAVTLVGVLHAADVVVGNAQDFRTRRMAADVGRWLEREFPTTPMLVGPVGITPIVSYYAHGSPYCAFRWEADDATILSMVDESKAGIVLLRPTKQLSAERCRILAERLEHSGLQPVATSTLPDTHADMQVLVRSHRNEDVARRLR